MRLSELCHDLKLGGAALEEAGAELDTLQARLVQVCQQSGLDLELDPEPSDTAARAKNLRLIVAAIKKFYSESLHQMLMLFVPHTNTSLRRKETECSCSATRTGTR